MNVFSSAWVDGKIDDINKLIEDNRDRRFMFILDTNFAIMARYYITEWDNFKKYYGKQTEDFINSIGVIKKNASRIIYALACEEASRSKSTGNIDTQKYALMVESIGRLFDIDFRKDVLSKVEVVDADVRYSKTPILLKNGLFKKQTVIAYTTILKAYLLKHFDDRDNKIKIKEMFNFMAGNINAFSPVGTSFVIHYLGNESSILKSTNPAQGIEKILNKIYAASIDMLMPTQASQLSELSGYSEVPIFVTFDKGIKLLFDSLLVMGEHRLENGKYVPEYSTKIYYSSGWKDADIIELCQYAQRAQTSRRKKVTKRELQRLNGLALNLEQELSLKIKNLK
jgi:hypothetical protein